MEGTTIKSEIKKRELISQIMEADSMTSQGKVSLRINPFANETPLRLKSII